VDGVFTADPRVVKKARKIDWISFEDMLELASSGSKVLLHRCVEYARRYNIPIHVRSSFSGLQGTWVSNESQGDVKVEQAIISGVAHDTSEAKVTVVGVPDKPGEAATIFRAIADSEVNIDMVVQNVSAASTGLTDISFTLPKAEGRKAIDALEKTRSSIGFSDTGVNIELISTSEIRISVVTRADDVNEAVRAVHTAFGLDSDTDEAVVYGGTGR
jgi:aspartate kinase